MLEKFLAVSDHGRDQGLEGNLRKKLVVLISQRIDGNDFQIPSGPSFAESRQGSGAYVENSDPSAGSGGNKLLEVFLKLEVRIRTVAPVFRTPALAAISDRPLPKLHLFEQRGVPITFQETQ